MTLKYKAGPIGGTTKAPRAPIIVWDDAFANISTADAITYAQGVAPASIFGLLQTDSPSFTELAGHIVQVEIEYSPPELDPPDPPPAAEEGTLLRRMNFQAQSKWIYNFIEPIGVYDESGDATADYASLKWKVNVQGKAFDNMRAAGLSVDPLPETRSLDFYAPNTVIDGTYLDLLEELCGSFNDDTFYGRPAGSVQLVRVNLTERSPDDWEISMGFGVRLAQTSVAVEDITIPTIRGCDIYWTRDKEVVSVDGLTELKAELAVVGRAWDLADFDAMSLPAISYP